MTGAERIQAERERQMLAEGFAADDDDEYTSGELILAAIGYAHEAVPFSSVVEATDGTLMERYEEEPGTIPAWWPWDGDWWRPSESPVRNLEKAGALIAAEIDRLERKRLRNA